MPSTHLYIFSGVFLVSALSESTCSCGSVIVVITMTWSDRPFNVSGSYSIRWVALAVIIRSMQDYPIPFSYVFIAGGPGWMPFSIYQPYHSHRAMTHGALDPTILSRLFLGIPFSPIVGYRSPIRAFQSPHMTDWEF